MHLRQRDGSCGSEEGATGGDDILSDFSYVLPRIGRSTNFKVTLIALVEFFDHDYRVEAAQAKPARV